MLVLAHNLLSQYTEGQLKLTSGNKKKSAERLSSGYRINRAADDAAALKISEKMRYQIRGLKRGERNIMDGISYIQVADSAMSEMHELVQRIRELAVQASNDTNTLMEREAMQDEISQLKKEINFISINTEFNNQQVFDNSYVMMEVDGAPNDLKIFNSSYDAATGDVAYGGFVFHGNRITWDEISPGMVTVDAGGNQTFVAGDYTYTDITSGYTFQITCKDGDIVPQITRNIQISADESGIFVDGKRFSWGDLKNEDGKGATSSNFEAGTWTLHYEGMDIAFFIGTNVYSYAEIADAINSSRDGKIQYSLHTKYVGAENEQAVNADAKMKKLHISQAFAQYITSNNGTNITVRAGDGQNGTQNGIWLEKDGVEIANSFLSWADMGIASWEHGSDISSSLTYQYSDSEGTNDTLLSFDFTLSDVTSLDSVIDGLDGMMLNAHNIRTDYSTYVNVTYDQNIQKVTSTAHNPIYFTEEKELGRDFDTQTIPKVGDSGMTYDAANDKAKLEFADGAGNVVLSYEGDVSAAKTQMSGSVSDYLAFVLQKKTAAALAGQDPQQVKLESATLTELLGTGNITTAGYFDQVLTMDDAAMTKTDGSSGYKPGEDGKTYPMAYMDFQNLGTSFTLEDLVGTGFNSTCKTCDNHYSVMFVDGITGGSTSANGYAYDMKAQGSQNYLLRVDIRSLRANGVTSGADLAEALVDITSECFDFHYTQYAAKGSKLYVYDNRESTTGTRDATFDTSPYYAMDTDSFNITVKTDDGRSISTNYEYDFGDVADSLVVEMQQDDTAGQYVRNADGSYSLYDAAQWPDPANQPPRFDMAVTYKKADGTAAADKDELAADYAANAIENMLTKTNVQLDAKDYTYLDVDGNELSNIAVDSKFEAYVKETPYENGIHIQISGQTWDSILLPRISMNTMRMHLYKANVTTWQGAQDAIGYADRAINYLSEKRTLYGAYQNRLEHIYANNKNTGENTTAAESRLRDTDMACEMVNYSKHSILEQAGQSILAQANHTTEGILNLLGR